MPGPIDKLELQFEDFNHSETSDTSEVQKWSFSENCLNLKTELVYWTRHYKLDSLLQEVCIKSCFVVSQNFFFQG